MKLKVHYIIALALIGCAHSSKLQQGSALVADPEWLKPVAQCENSREDDRRYVAFLKQWHLSPKANTISSDPKTFDQFENQYALYKQLEKWIEGGVLRTVVVEGCEGEIKSDFKTTYNGQNLQQLMKLSPTELDFALTQIGIKLKARFKDKVTVICGDSDRLIKEHGLVLSDIRGLAGFYERASQSKTKDPKAHARYLEALKEVLKLPVKTSEKEVMATTRRSIQKNLDRYEELLHARNESFLDVMSTIKDPTIAVVLGGLHMEDFFERLSQRGDACDFFEPAGYLKDEGMLLEALRNRFEES